MSKFIKICHISTVHQPFDDRIYYKQCRTLAKNGYDVTLIVEHYTNERIDMVQIDALPPSKSRWHRFLVNSLRAFVKGLKNKAILIHFHDPELIPIGLLFRIFGRKVIYDVHELVYHHFEQKEWLNPLLRWCAKSVYRLFENLAVIFFNKIILVVDDDSFRSYFMNNYSGRKHKFVFVRNFSMISMIDQIMPADDNFAHPVMIYAGGLSKIRGIREIIHAVGELKYPALLLLFGQWSDEVYKRQCMEEPGWSRVRDMGYQKLEVVYPYMKIADLGFALLYPMKNYLTSLPVKAFEYMACSLPILMSDFPFWMRTFREGAWFVNPGDAGQIRLMLEQILADGQEMKRKGNAGRKLVEHDFSWEVESKRLLDCYKEILS